MFQRQSQMLQIKTKEAVQMIRYISSYATRGQTVSLNRQGGLVLAFIEVFIICEFELDMTVIVLFSKLCLIPCAYYLAAVSVGTKDFLDDIQCALVASVYVFSSFSN